MRAVFAWSWQLLSDAERHILRQCAIFRGGFTYAAAQEVVGATLHLLTRLTDKSLFQWQSAADGEGRYIIHELLRQFAAEELTNEAAEKVLAVHGRYAQYYLRWISQLTAQVPPDRRTFVIAELQHEMENCRQAWWLAVQQGWIDLVAVGLPGFAYVWRRTGCVVEVEKLVSDTIQSLSSAASNRTSKSNAGRIDSQLAALLIEHSRMLHTQRRYEAALRVAHSAVQLAEQSNDPSLLASSLLMVAKSANDIGAQKLEFVPFAQRALDIARQHGLRKSEATALLFLIDSYPQLEQQIALINDALNIAQELRDLNLEGMGLELLSGAFENYGQCARALPYRQRIFEFAQMQNHTVEVALALSNHANTYLFLECYDRSLALRQQLLGHCEHHRLEWWKSRNYGQIAYIYWAMGDLEQAFHWICIARSHETDSQMLIQLQDYYLALILLARRKLSEALQVARCLLTQTRVQAEKHPPYLLCCLSLLAQIHSQSGALTEAMRYVEESIQILTDYPHISMPVVHWELVAIYLTCYEVLQQANDPRATVWLKLGYEQLQSQAAHIEAPDLRHSFLQNIVAHRKLLDAWQSRTGSALKA